MRQARITYDGAIHHAMNRGHDGLPIFKTDLEKQRLLDLIEINALKLKVSILAYCIMDNHYHLIIQNSSGRMSDFFRKVNAEYARYFRKKQGGRGYVFQDRYKSMLIQEDGYLLVSIAYVLNNPVRTKLTDLFYKYKWSSGSIYFKETENLLVCKSFVESLFSDLNEFYEFVSGNDGLMELPFINTEMGKIIGGDEFYVKSLKKFNRREEGESVESMRSDDAYFEPVEKIYFEFKNKHGISPDELDIRTIKGKRLRGEFLIALKDHGGLTYREIKKFDIFSDVKFHSLGGIYRRTKNRK